jgi:hypothetical protein
LVYSIVSWILRVSRDSKPRVVDGRMVFDALIPVKVLLTVITVGFLAGSAYCALSAGSPLGTIIFGVIGVAGVASFPSIITVDGDGLTERKWWVRTTNVPWVAVKGISYRQGPGTTVIIAESGARITHCGFHRASKEFRLTCTKYSHRAIKTSQF